MLSRAKKILVMRLVMFTVCVCVCVLTALVQMTTMTGLSSIASLSLGLSMSMSSGQAGGVEKAARLQSQLSMIATSNDGPVASSRPRRSSPAVLAPPPRLDDHRSSSPSARPGIKRQTALCPSPISEQPSSPDTEPGVQDGHVTVVSF